MRCWLQANLHLHDAGDATETTIVIRVGNDNAGLAKNARLVIDLDPLRDSAPTPY